MPGVEMQERTREEIRRRVNERVRRALAEGRRVLDERELEASASSTPSTADRKQKAAGSKNEMKSGGEMQFFFVLYLEAALEAAPFFCFAAVHSSFLNCRSTFFSF